MEKKNLRQVRILVAKNNATKNLFLKQWNEHYYFKIGWFHKWIHHITEDCIIDLYGVIEVENGVIELVEKKLINFSDHITIKKVRKKRQTKKP